MMGDKANTKHGNMVALPNSGNAVTTANLTVKPYEIFALPTTLNAKADLTMPFAGSVSAFVHSGDYAGAGTWTCKLRINGTIKTSATLTISQAVNTWEAPSPNAITFEAGDTIGFVAATSSDFVQNDDGEAFVTPYVIFRNS